MPIISFILIYFRHTPQCRNCSIKVFVFPHLFINITTIVQQLPYDEMMPIPGCEMEQRATLRNLLEETLLLLEQDVYHFQSAILGCKVQGALIFLVKYIRVSTILKKNRANQIKHCINISHKIQEADF